MPGDDRLNPDAPRHPLPASDEARREELPENLIDGKGTGDDGVEAVQPADLPVSPDGETYDAGVRRGSVEQIDQP